MALAAQGATPVSPDPAGDLERGTVTKSSWLPRPRGPGAELSQNSGGFSIPEVWSCLLPGHVSGAGTGPAGLPSVCSPTLGGAARSVGPLRTLSGAVIRPALS